MAGRAVDMRKGSGIAGATLLFTSQRGQPDLLKVMQCLVDDLRADSRRIVGLRYAGQSLRLRADPWDMVLTLADEPLPLAAMGGLLRPPRPDDAPDFARVHLARALRLHRHALGFLLRRRGALPAEPLAARALAREGQLCLLAIFHAAPPALLIWQPGGLVLTPEELRSADPALLLTPREAAVPMSIPRPERLALARPDAARPAGLPESEPTRPDPDADKAPPPLPAPRLFGKDQTALPLQQPGLERAGDRVASALRGTAASRVPGLATPRRRGGDAPFDPRAGPAAAPRRLAAPVAVVLLWAVLLPDLMARLLPRF